MEHDKLRKIFDEVINLESKARDARLVDLCGDDHELRDRIDALVLAANSASGFLSGPTLTVLKEANSESTDMTPGEIDLLVGMRIGSYKLLELIGEGGFGAVYVAEQIRPVRRRVALKLIKLGMDTKQVIARFEAERQALAMMDHPSIARVLDAGVSDSGRPWFAMELVKGVSITEYCDAVQLPASDRLRLFMSVCNAIQHAHQKGVIHRDIKPSNILISLHDGTPVPKVIDFGIAKAIGCQLTDKTVYTLHRQLIGTPAYMSPEQAEFGGLDIDTRSDIYSLGVLLYELLTGVTPFRPKELFDAGIAEMQRIIREVEPVKPSTRVRTLGKEATSIAAKRKVDPDRLGYLLRGDLDWISMKCLEKDRTRRYGTATELAADVQRHLTGHAINAAPPSPFYRMKKIALRNRRSIMATSFIFVALIIGFLFSSWQWHVAEIEKVRADFESYLGYLNAAQFALEGDRIEEARDLIKACPLDYRGWEYRLLLRRIEAAATVMSHVRLLAKEHHHNGRQPEGEPIDDGTLLLFDLPNYVVYAPPNFVFSARVNSYSWEKPGGGREIVPMGQNNLAIGKRKDESLVWNEHAKKISAELSTFKRKDRVRHSVKEILNVIDTKGRPSSELIRNKLVEIVSNGAPCTITDDLQRVITAHSDGTLRVWDSISCRQLLSIQLNRFVTSLRFLENKNMLAIWRVDGSVLVLEAAPPKYRAGDDN